jgi:FkbM family methyltransferase
MKAISVCISTYEMGGKGPDFLRFSFERLTKQTLKDFDVVISDQSKNEGIKNVCDEYSSKLDIHYFKESPSSTPSDNNNNAMRRAQGKLIKILFLDDFLYSDTSLEDIVKNFDLKKDKWLLTPCIHTKDGIEFYRPFYPSYDDTKILFKNTISAPSVVTLINDDPTLFDQRLVWWQDLDFYKRCYERYGAPKILKDVNVAIRVHGNQMGNSSKEKIREDEYRYILKKHHIHGFWKLSLIYKVKKFKRQFKSLIKRNMGEGATRLYLSIKKSVSNVLAVIKYRITFYPLCVRFGTSDVSVLEQVFIKKNYNIDFGDMNPKLIIDGGANVGYTSVLFAKRFPHAQIYSIEPETSNFAVLKKNASRFPNIHPLNNGLWHTSGKLDIVDSGLGEWAFMTTESSSTSTASIDALTIDDILKMSGSNKIDILKLDIEGAEKELFSKNYESWLGKVDTLIIELHDRMKPGSSAAFYSAIEKYGFTRELKDENVVLRRNI